MKYNLTINPPKCYWPKKKGVSQNGQTPSIIGICSYCVLDRPVFERCQTLLHPELTPWWSFLLADGAHHKKPHSPTHPNDLQKTTDTLRKSVMALKEGLKTNGLRNPLQNIYPTTTVTLWLQWLHSSMAFQVFEKRSEKRYYEARH